jgi:hypothetical protein
VLGQLLREICLYFIYLPAYVGFPVNDGACFVIISYLSKQELLHEYRSTDGQGEIYQLSCTVRSALRRDV